MDASDILKQMQNKTIYTYYKKNILSLQAACNYSTCSTPTGCSVPVYTTYELRQQVTSGQQVCNSCSNIGCTCGS